MVVATCHRMPKLGRCLPAAAGLALLAAPQRCALLNASSAVNRGELIQGALGSAPLGLPPSRCRPAAGFRREMDTRHWHVISKLAEAFDVKEGVVTNFIRRAWGSRRQCAPARRGVAPKRAPAA